MGILSMSVGLRDSSCAHDLIGKPVPTFSDHAVSALGLTLPESVKGMVALDVENKAKLICSR
jgi:hypothetical protein